MTGPAPRLPFPFPEFQNARRTRHEGLVMVQGLMDESALDEHALPAAIRLRWRFIGGPLR
jgi:hypothetical protein